MQWSRRCIGRLIFVKILKPRRKRTRVPSLETQIRESAKQIHATGMQEAMKAAAYMVVAKKLDELKAILQGISTSPNARNLQFDGVQHQVNGAGVRVEGGAVVEHPCSYCGRESVYRTRPHKFNRTGTWLCRAHLPLRRQHEQAQVTDTRARDANGVVQEEAPVVALAPEKKDTGADTTADSVMAALGVN